MFDRYTEKARRVIFFARYEASQFGSPHIEPGHLLLGILREDKAFGSALLKTGAAAEVEEFRRQLVKPGAEKTSTSVDLPLSKASKRVLAFALEEVEARRDPHIDTVHLALGVLRENDPLAAGFLKSRGVDLEPLLETPRAETGAEPGPKRSRMREKIEALIKGLGNDVSVAREGDLNEGRFSYTHTKEGERTIRSHHFVGGHEIRVIERMQVAENGKALRYSIEIQGPGEEHRHEIEFPL